MSERYTFQDLIGTSCEKCNSKALGWELNPRPWISRPTSETKYYFTETSAKCEFSAEDLPRQTSILYIYHWKTSISNYFARARIVKLWEYCYIINFVVLSLIKGLWWKFSHMCRFIYFQTIYCLICNIIIFLRRGSIKLFRGQIICLDKPGQAFLVCLVIWCV